MSVTRTKPYLRTIDERIAGHRTYRLDIDRIPDNAVTFTSFTPVTDITDQHGAVLRFDPANMLFIPGGSIAWVEDPDSDQPVFCLVAVGDHDGTYRKYPMTRREADRD